jgi:diguanylate cyclase (GGDEF)-like protein
MVLDTLIHSLLFQGVPSPTVAAIVAGSELRELAPQDILLRRGAVNDTLYIVVSGSLSVDVARGNQPYVRLGVGECVGELSILDGQEVSADVTAEEPTVVLAVDQDQLWWLIESSAEVARNLFRILAGRVRHDDVALGEAKQLQSHFERIATIDALTGLRNRRWLDDIFARQLERAARTNQPASLLMIDVDHFKALNDEHGHPVGDAVLCRLAELLAGHLRPQDLLARYGGEEFVVLLPDIDGQSARSSAERLRHVIESSGRDVPRGALPTVTVSIGVAWRRHDDTLGELLRRADEALYRAKQTGRNRTSE